MKADFHKRINDLINICNQKYGVTVTQFQGDVDYKTQARLWTQSRTSYERDKACEYLEANSAPRIAEVLREQTSLCGRWATNSLPGGSWQQFGEAVLLVAVENGRAVWKRECPAYRWLAFEAVPLGLFSGYNYAVPDVQLITAHRRSPIKEHGWAKIEQLLLDTLPLSSPQTRLGCSGRM